MEDYLHKFKVLADQLALASSSVDDEDLVLLILNGLPEEYNAFKTTIRARSDPITVDQLCSLLCSESIHIESSLKHKQISEIPGSAAYIAPRGQYANKGSQKGYYRGRGSVRGRDRGRFHGQMSSY